MTSTMNTRYKEILIDSSAVAPKYDPADHIMFIVGMPSRHQLEECFKERKIAFIMVLAPYTEPNQELSIDPLAATSIRINNFVKQWIAQSPKRKDFGIYTSVTLVGYYKTVNNKKNIIEQFKQKFSEPDNWFIPAGFDRGTIDPVTCTKLPNNINQFKEV